MTDAATEQTPREKLQAAITQLGLTIESVFVPFSQSRNKGEKHPSLNWKVTVRRQYAPGHVHDVLTTDYMAGCAHAPGYGKKPSIHWDRPARMWQMAVAAWECEHGYQAAYFSYASGFTRANVGGKHKPIHPDAVDVLWSLTQDSNVLDAGGFEEWAREYDYDTDSRQAEATYRACLDIALKLRAAIGDAGLQLLRDAGQGY